MNNSAKLLKKLANVSFPSQYDKKKRKRFHKDLKKEHTAMNSGQKAKQRKYLMENYDARDRHGRNV